MNALHRFTVVALLALGPGLPQTLAAQDTTRGMSALMLKRLGEAVDGYRTGRPNWVVMSLRFPHQVYGVFPSREAAAAGLRRAGSGYDIFGPYYASTDRASDSTFYFGFVYCPDHSWWTECPDTTREFEAVAATAVDSVTVAIHSGTRTIRRRYQRGQVDALFFTLSAVDKFAIPYYARLYGVEYAARMRARYLEGFQGIR